ncbi:MAG: C2H2-type zinc finger protein [Candidatus Nitrosopolaris sp.]
MSVVNSLFDQAEEYACKICGRTFSTTQSLAAHIDSEHPEVEQPEIF